MCVTFCAKHGIAAPPLTYGRRKYQAEDGGGAFEEIEAPTSEGQPLMEVTYPGGVGCRLAAVYSGFVRVSVAGCCVRHDRHGGYPADTFCIANRLTCARASTGFAAWVRTGWKKGSDVGGHVCVHTSQAEPYEMSVRGQRRLYALLQSVWRRARSRCRREVRRVGRRW